MTAALTQILAAFQSSAPISAINFHNTPATRASEYDRELGILAEHFSSATEDDLAYFFKTGSWRHKKPGLIIALYNGYRNNYDVFYPLLEKHGLTWWFFAASAYASCSPKDQPAFAARNVLRTIPGEYVDGRTAMDWDELRDLDRRHVVASHTRNHATISVDDVKAMENEIVGSQDDFRTGLGHPVKSFAWLWKGTYGESPLTDACLDRAGYEFLFSSSKIQRLPLRDQ